MTQPNPKLLLSVPHLPVVMLGADSVPIPESPRVFLATTAGAGGYHQCLHLRDTEAEASEICEEFPQGHTARKCGNRVLSSVSFQNILRECPDSGWKSHMTGPIAVYFLVL